MHLLTDGLKLAAGRALEGMLERWTSTPARGLAAGILITTLVQSSSAVTVAGIGFVNAGLLSLRNALWVIFGSNVGTTMNAWLVAALGFSFDIDAFALPVVGAGAALMLAARSARPRALGQALAGFGVLFLGIDALKDTFAGFGSHVDLTPFILPGVGGWAVLVAIGIVLTLLMQASGAAIAVVITAAAGGLLPTEAACAMVIGTNIGTTSTAVLSALGATANARRLAAAHVFFNLVTGAVALALLPLLIGLLSAVRAWLGQVEAPAVTIAMFHTSFNLLGVALMVPATPWLLRFLEGRFHRREEDAARPQFLDANSLSVADLALRALRLELGRTQALAATCLDTTVAAPADEGAIERGRDTLLGLAAAIGDYARKISAAALPATLVSTLARCLRVLQYQESAVDICHHAGELARVLGPTPLVQVHPATDAFLAAAAALARAADPAGGDFDIGALSRRLATAEECYGRLKEALLVAGADGHLPLREMQDRLRHASLLRRAAEQTAKAASTLLALDGVPSNVPKQEMEAKLAEAAVETA